MPRRPLASALLDLVLPPRCPGCGALVDAPERFCADCWGTLDLIAPPWCARCHRPFEHDRGDDACCEACVVAPPLAPVRAAVAYGEVARTLALGLKYAGRRGHANAAARLMRRHLPGDATLLVPVPLHRGRLWSRGYNQAQWLAAALAHGGAARADARVLERHRATSSLKGRSRFERRQAVAGAFRLRDGARVAGERVVLVDDVHTTGATAEACAQVLLAGGAASVTVLAWARVLEPAD